MLEGIAQQPHQLVTGRRQFLDDGLELALHLVDGVRRAAQDGARDQRGADRTHDAYPLQPAHQWIERVGHQYAQQQRHQEVARGPQREDEGHRRQHAQRQPARVDVQGEAQATAWRRLGRKLGRGGAALAHGARFDGR